MPRNHRPPERCYGGSTVEASLPALPRHSTARSPGWPSNPFPTDPPSSISIARPIFTSLVDHDQPRGTSIFPTNSLNSNVSPLAAPSPTPISTSLHDLSAQLDPPLEPHLSLQNQNRRHSQGLSVASAGSSAIPWQSAVLSDIEAGQLVDL
jgi:hypothetical protein